MSEDFQITRVHAHSSTCPGQRFRSGRTTNVWIVGDNRNVVIVDPAGSPRSVSGAIGSRQVTAVICTHGHRAHIAAAMTFGENFCAPVLIHPADHAAWLAVHGKRRYWRLDDGQRIAVAGEEIRVLHTPSTTPGSVTLHIARHAMAFTGDALTHQNRGVEQGQTSVLLDTFAALPPDTRIHPGHGNSYLLSEMFTDQAHRWDRQSA